MEAIGPPMPRYRYEPLAERHIRLLYLDQTEDGEPLRGRVEHALLDTAEFYAYSYVWGDPEREYRMEVQGPDGPSEILLTKSLYKVLKDAKKHLSLVANTRRWGFAFEIDLRSSTAIWVDQICINQDSHIERAAQVAIMGDIYTKALAVITYIGPVTPDSAAGMAKLEDLYFRNGPLTMPAWDPIKNEELDDEGIIRLLNLDTWTTSVWCGVLEVLDCDWPDRVWTLQENVLNEKRVVACGDRIMPWDCLVIICTLICNYRFVHSALLYDFAVGTPQRDRINARYPRIMFMEWLHLEISRKRKSRPNTWGCNLTGLLYTFWDTNCQDPRDKVFALLGLAADTKELDIRPNYERSYLDIYRDVAKHSIVQEGTLNMLNQAAIESCKSPSWVPDWSLARHDRPTTVHKHVPGKPFRVPPSFEDSDNTLVLEGIFVDEIRVDCGVWATMWSLNSTLCTWDVLLRICLMARLGAVSEEGAVTRLAVFLTQPSSFIDMDKQKDMIDKSVSWINKMGLMGTLDVGDSERLLLREFVDILMWHLCVTMQKRFCTSKQQVRSGDRIAVLFGGTRCYILRPTENTGRYSFVSDAYLEDFMDGQALANPELATKVETIRIV